MTAAQSAALFFSGSAEATKKRLQKLKTAGLIAERRRNPFQPAILSLTRKAIALLAQEGILNDYPKLDPAALQNRASVGDLTIRHELEVMDVKVAFHAALTNGGRFSVAEFSTWPLLYQFEAFRPGFNGAEVPVKPDGFIRIHEKEPDGGLSEHAFFLELDRSSKTQDKLIAQAGCYMDYHRSGGFAVRNGGRRDQFKEYPFRVLMVFKTAERRNNTAERLLRSTPPILSQACLTTFDEVTRDPLAPIWIRPIDYRNATDGTPFSTARERQAWGYKRETERELLVEQRVKKWRILINCESV